MMRLVNTTPPRVWGSVSQSLPLARSASFGSSRSGSSLRQTTFWCVLLGLGLPLVWETQFAFSAPLNLDSSVALVARYDNNLFLSESDPIGGFSTVVAPRVNLQIDQRLIQTEIRYQATAQWYRQRAELNRFTQQGELDAALRGLRRWVRHLDLRLQGSYTRMTELPGTFLSGEPVSRGGVLLPATIESSEWRGSITAGYAWSGRLQSGLGYRYTATYFDEVDNSISIVTASTFDSIVHDAHLSGSYRQSPRTTLKLTAGLSATRLTPSGTPFPSADDTRTTARLTAGAEYLAASALRVEGEVGVMVIEDDQARLALNLDLERHWSDTQLRVRARQESGVGGGVTDTVSVRRSLSADASRPVGRHTWASLRLGIIENMSTPVLAADPTVRVVTFGAGAGVGHALTGWLTVRFDYSSLTQRSSGIAVAGQRHLFVVTLTATGPQWSSR